MARSFSLLASAGILVGLSLIGYGYLAHKTTVFAKTEQGETKPPSQPTVQPDIWSADWAPPVPAPPPAERAVTVTDGELIRDATLGGIERQADGRLLRTYSGKPAGKCPT